MTIAGRSPIRPHSRRLATIAGAAALTLLAAAFPPAGGAQYAPFDLQCGSASPSLAEAHAVSNGTPACSAGVGAIALSAAGAGVDERVLLLRFADLYSEGTSVRRAWLRMWDATPTAADPMSIAGDWFDWGSGCDATDLSAPAADPALSAAGACGAACNLDGFNSHVDLELDDPAAHVRLDGGAFHLRVRIQGGAPTGGNTLQPSSEWPGSAQLVVEECAPFAAPLPATCQIVTLPATAEAFTRAEAIDAPPAPMSCATDAGNDSLLLQNSQRPQGGGTLYEAANPLLRFDTSGLPTGTTPYRALVRVRTVAGEPNFGAGAIAGEWFDWGPTCDLDDHANEGLSDAISFASPCGPACALANVRFGTDEDFHVTNATTHLDPTGSSALRLRVEAGEGINEVTIGNTASGAGPRLLVLACELDPPTIDPPAGCQVQVLASPDESFIGFDITPAGVPHPGFFMCLTSVDSASTPMVVGGDMYDVDGADLLAHTLLRWDTAALPSGWNIEAAWLRLFVGQRGDDGDARLVADWDDWGECDADDMSRAPQTVALSATGACGSACDIDALPSPGWVDLPLDNPSDGIVRGTAAVTNLRVRIEATNPTGFNHVYASDSASALPGPGLVVLLCDHDAPAAPNGGQIIAWGIVDGQIAVTGRPGSVEGGAQVTIINTRTGTQVVVIANADGSFTAPLLSVQERDELSILVRDQAGNESSPSAVSVLSPAPELVAPALDRTVATTVADSTAFLYSGALAVQVGVAPGTIEDARAAVVRGLVEDRDGAPLPGVRVSIHDHPEYGYTLSRPDGTFDLAVNGGGRLVVDYDGVDTLSVQRAVDVPWQGYAHADSVALVTPIASATVVTLGAGAPAQEVVASESDANGSRTARLFIPAGTEAEYVMPEGSRVAVTEPLTVRLTEYTVGPRGPQAMPGELPPASAYTYAFEVSVDEIAEQGAVTLEFTQPLPFYVDNFLDFPIGGVVPVGQYDREAAEWVPEANGRVVKVVTVDGGGLARLDADGDGDADGADDTILASAVPPVTNGERLALAPQLGKGLWRVGLRRTVPLDCNWPGLPPADAIVPNGGPPTGGDDALVRLSDDEASGDGRLVYETQTLVERLPVAGTPFMLEYRTDQQRGRTAGNEIAIPISGTVPPSLKRIERELQVAGRRFVSAFTSPPLTSLANLSETFAWDGLDAYGRPVQGRANVQIAITFVYDRVYATPGAIGSAFAQPGDPQSPIGDNRAEIYSVVHWNGALGAWDAAAEGLGGFSLDVHKSYDPVSGTLTAGDGSSQAAAEVGPVIQRAVGETAGFGGDGNAATAAQLREPHKLAVAADGTLYVADTGNHRIRRVGPDGIISTIAGTGTPGFTGDGGAATAARLRDPRGVAVGPDGTLYIADSSNHRVRQIAHDGTITTFAGTGGASFGGDGGPATSAALNSPSSVRISTDGTVFIADSANDRVRAVDPTGTIRTIAGGGANCCNNSRRDGILATSAKFFGVNDIALGADGSLYVAGGTERVRRVDPSGYIYTAAGGGGSGGGGNDLGGDGAPAVGPLDPNGAPISGARFINPRALAVARDGTLYIADSNAHRVRRVSADGIISAVAGTGFSGATGDLGAAAGALLNEPRGLAVAPDGSLYVADTINHRVRKITSALPGFAGIDDLPVAGADGRTIDVFNSRGRHLRTIDSLVRDGGGGATVLYQFGYGPSGHLASITDADGRVTAVDGAGTSSVTITAPDGQQTSIALVDTGGAVDRIVTTPEAATVLHTTADGLVSGVTDPRGHTRTYTYDGNGRLATALDPPGVDGGDTFSRTSVPVLNGTGFEVTRTTAGAVETTYRVEVLPTGEERRTILNPDGTQDVTLIGVDRGRTITAADGTVRTTAIGPDPRFGLQAPVAKGSTLTTPDGLTASVVASRDTIPPVPPNPLAITSQTESVSVNGRPSATSLFTTATRVTTDTSPAGRVTQTTVDTKGRVTRVQAAGLHPLRLTYDAVSGQPTTMKYGPDPDTGATRTTTVTYVDDFAIAFDDYPAAAKGQVKTTTDAAGRTTTFEYDGAGRVAAQILPGNRRVEFQYDPAGNVTSITPPGRPAHAFAYTPVDLEEAYTPPQVVPPLANVETTYAYTADRQLDLVTRPDGDTVDYQYDPAGRLDTVTLSAGSELHDYVYDDVGGPGDQTGNLAQIVTPSTTLAFAYDGSLPTGEAWSGAGLAPASVTKTYDASLRLASQQIAVGGVPQPAIAFQYDHDDLLTQAGALTLTPDPATGLLRGTTLTAGGGTVTDTIDYTPFGEVEHYEARHDGNELLDFLYERDALGRITRITETLTLAPDPPVVTDTHYRYDPAGRLYRVCADAACVTIQAEYHYDPNGNRIAPSFDARGPISATYDAQDRLLAMTAGGTTTTYTYTANGELETKTDTPGGTTTYAYDAFGNLRQVALPDNTVIDYVVDGRNRRIGKIVDGTLVRQWLYQDQLEPVAELDGQGNVVGEFVYGSKPHVPDVIRRGADAYRVLSDHLGSVRLVVNTFDGSVAQELSYDAFGRIVQDTAPAWQPFAFSGGLQDQEIGLTRFGARDFDVLSGRWIAKDPLRFGGGDPGNLYSYVLADPVNLTDPTGLAHGPWHPPAFVKTKCRETDMCPTIIGKMWVLQRMIASHEGWDWNMAAPRGGGRHAKEIADLWQQLSACQAIYDRKCKCSVDPEVAKTVGRIGATTTAGFLALRSMMTLQPVLRF